MPKHWEHKVIDTYWDCDESELLKLAPQGWELVAAINPSNLPPAVVVLFLKRPKA